MTKLMRLVAYSVGAVLVMAFIAATWYLITLGDGANFHTPHWHGNTVIVRGQRTDVVAINPAQMVTADMVPDDPGTWLVHCHVSDHMDAGMMARYQVTQ